MTLLHDASPDFLIAGLDAYARGLILAEWDAGRNTCEIGRALGVHEADVAEVVRADRERRAGADAGRREQ